MNLGLRIKFLVKRDKSLNNRKLASLLGVSEPSLYKIFKSEDGDNITIGVAKRISSLLKVPFADLFGIHEEDQLGAAAAIGTGNAAGDITKRPGVQGGLERQKA